jgi:hypothetical protein
VQPTSLLTQPWHHHRTSIPKIWSFSSTPDSVNRLSYRESEASSTSIHTLHVHVWAKDRNLASLITICFQAFKERLCIVQNCGTRFDAEWSICTKVVSGNFLKTEDPAESEVRTRVNSRCPPSLRRVPWDRKHMVRLGCRLVLTLKWRR